MNGDPKFGMPGMPGMPAMPNMDAFTAFWADLWSRMAAAGAPPPPNPPADFIERTRKAFFDAMARALDEYMRSEAFLHGMRQSMDQALGWQKMMNDYLQRGLSAAQIPTRDDADHVVRLIHGMEDRLIAKIEQLETRLNGVERAGKRGGKE